MSNYQPPEPVHKEPLVLFFGMPCPMSVTVLKILLFKGISIAAVIVPAPSQAAPIRQYMPSFRQGRRGFPVQGSVASLKDLAIMEQIPVWEVAQLKHVETLSTLASYRPDVISVACFPSILPSALLALPTKGVLNLHPSLLPRHRGPEPLFWTLYECDAVTGITIHLMSERIDAGPILAQEQFVVPEGIRYRELEQLCAQKGGELLVQTILGWYADRIVPQPQDEQRQSYQSFPTAEHLRVYAWKWQARSLFSFIRGVAEWAQGIEVIYCNERGEKEAFVAHDGVSYSHKTVESRLDGGKGDGIGMRWVRCLDGEVLLTR